MRVYLDDERTTPEGWVRTFTPAETIDLIKTGDVSEISLDHDLGDDEGIGTGYDVLLWLEEKVYFGFEPPEINIHSANPSAVHKMLLAVTSINKLVSDRWFI